MFNISSRTIELLTESTISTSGRDVIHTELITALNEHPFIGFGILGDEIVLNDISDVYKRQNVDYVLKHNPDINPEKVEICSNSVEVVDMSVDEKTRDEIRRKYDIPLDKKIFVYGGNLGKPQGIDSVSYTHLCV